jgi:uncharacterized phage-associated protein
MYDMERSTTMLTVLDASNYIIKLSTDIGEPVTNMKLQKLLFYSYVWNLVEYSKDKLFKEPIVAWKYGPVIVAAYHAYKKYGADSIKEASDGDPDKLTQKQKDIIEDVFNIYGKMNGIELAQLTHSERPWLEAYEEGKENIITDEIMYEFYSAKKERIAMK